MRPVTPQSGASPSHKLNVRHLNLFDGSVGFEPARDGKRLTKQLDRVRTVLKSGNWYTDQEIADITGDPVTSVGTRRRDLRKDKFGKHTIHSECVRRGLWKYRMEVPPQLRLL